MLTDDRRLWTKYYFPLCALLLAQSESTKGAREKRGGEQPRAKWSAECGARDETGGGARVGGGALRTGWPRRRE